MDQKFRRISSLKIDGKPNWTTPEKKKTFMTWICCILVFFANSHFEYRKFRNIEYSNRANPRISRVAGRQVVPDLNRARCFHKRDQTKGKGALPPLRIRNGDNQRINILKRKKQSYQSRNHFFSIFQLDFDRLGNQKSDPAPGSLIFNKNRC